MAPEEHHGCFYSRMLKDGDSVTLIKDLKVKGAGTTLKRGTHDFVHSPYR